MRFLLTLALAFLILSLPASSGSGSDVRSKAVDNGVSVDRLDSTPDLMQSLPGNGLMYCSPVAVSNSMVCLSHHDYPKLALSGADTPASQG